jgi:hypothetical protein
VRRFTDDAAGKFWGFRLLIPRGQLDISYRDLVLRQGVLHNYITSAALSLRQGDYKSVERLRVDPVLLSVPVVVGSVLYEKYPAGSKSFAINIPGMMQHYGHHQLKVAVDLPNQYWILQLRSRSIATLSEKPSQLGPLRSGGAPVWYD